jgi:hypothetical protein
MSGYAQNSEHRRFGKEERCGMHFGYKLAWPPQVGHCEFDVECQSEGALEAETLGAGRVLDVSFSVRNDVAVVSLAIVLDLISCDNVPKMFSCSGGVLQQPS